MCLLFNWEKRHFSNRWKELASLLFLSHHFFIHLFRGREKGRCDSPLSLPRTLMTYPDEGRES